MPAVLSRVEGSIGNGIRRTLSHPAFGTSPARPGPCGVSWTSFRNLTRSFLNLTGSRSSGWNLPRRGPEGVCCANLARIFNGEAL